MTNDALLACGGLVLAGGRSSRFGGEKAAAEFRGRTLLEIAIERFAGLVVSVSAAPGSAAAELAAAGGLEVLSDDPALARGPLAGVCRGLGWAAERGFAFLATVPCDAPLLPGDLVPRLLQEIGDAPAAFAVASDGEHALCALWRPALRAPLLKILETGTHPPVKAFLAGCGARRVHFPDARAFANVNTRADLLRFAEAI